MSTADASAHSVQGSTTSLKPTIGIDWPGFLSRHDLLWNVVPPNWDESAFLGNGLLGALIYTHESNTLGWSIGRTDVTDHQQGPNPMFRKPRLPIGRMVLNPVGQMKGGSARLDLWNAEARGIITTDCGEITWRSFVHSEDQVLIIELETTGKEDECRWQWKPELAINPRKVYRNLPIGKDDLNPASWVEERGEARVSVQALLAGGEYATAWTEQRISDRRRLLYLSVANTFDKPGARDEAVRAVETARTQGLDFLMTGHRQWWHAYYPTSFLSVPDTKVESLYWIQMYKLASGTRADRPALDLMGPWYGPTPWPGIWWNMNIQVCYSMVYAANRLSLGESFLRLLDNNVPNLILNAPKEFQHDSAGIGVASSYDCRDDVDADPASGISWARPGYETIGNLTWALYNYWLHYRHCMDDAMLRDRLFPLLKRSINLYLHLLKRGEDGKLHLPLTWSPEYPDLAEDTHYELSLLRWGCHALLSAVDRLQIDDPLRDRWREVLTDLTPYPVDDTGFMIGKGVPLKRSHRHYSHLMAIYPLYLFTGDKAENLELINRSLKHWVDLKEAFVGFSNIGAAGIASSIGRGEEALGYIDNLISYIEPNTLSRESGPVTETGLGGATSVQELLLQSWGGKLRVFPAVPKNWDNACFHGLRAEGAFLVSALRKDGRTRFIQITSEAGEPCLIKTDMALPLKVASSRTVPLRTKGDGLVELELRKGETAILYSDAPSNFVIEPVPAQKDFLNYFGSAAAADHRKNPVTCKRGLKPKNIDAISVGDPSRTRAEYAAEIHIVLVGDSTVTEEAGWGKAFAELLEVGVRCTNVAKGGQSTKSFLDQGLLAAALKLHPTHVLIQFGHNDMPGKGPDRETDPESTYRHNLTRFIKEVREAGAVPILVTPVTRRNFSPQGELIDGLAPYAAAMKAVAQAENVPLIDLHARSIEAVKKLGPKGSEELGPISPDGKRDYTHLSSTGRTLTARLLAAELHAALPALASYLTK